MVRDRKYHAYKDERLDSRRINLCQFQCNPHLETTITARLNPKHVDERARIVQKTASKISQTVRFRSHVRRWGWVGPYTGKSFRSVSCVKVGITVILDLLHQMIMILVG